MESSSKESSAKFSTDNVSNIEDYFESKNLLGPCVEAFTKKILKCQNYPNLLTEIIRLTHTGNLNSLNIRPFAWRLMLRTLPALITTSLKDWVEQVKSQRISYKKKLKKYSKPKIKKDDDPLNPNKDSSWGSFFEEKDLKHIITLDINRTFQDKPLFCEQFIKDTLLNVLFIWSKENSFVSYKQGMNEIAAIIIFALFPYYFRFGNATESLNLITEDILDNPISNNKTIYMFFHDEAYLEADLYTLFNSMMKEGVTSLYVSENISGGYGQRIELFDEFFPVSNLNEKGLCGIYVRCCKVIKQKFRAYDDDYLTFLEKSRIDCTTFLQRWLKCFFSREFHPKDTIVLWDVILGEEMLAIEANENDNFEFIDYIAIAMLIYVKDQVLGKDENQVLMRLFKYPPVESPNILIQIALRIRINLDSKLSGLKTVADNKKKLAAEKKLREQKEKSLRENELATSATNGKKEVVPEQQSAQVKDPEISPIFQQEYTESSDIIQKSKLIEKLIELKKKCENHLASSDISDFDFVIKEIEKKMK